MKVWLDDMPVIVFYFTIMKRKRKSITLTLTQSCNLHCSYCFEANKTHNAMTFETAKQIIDKEVCDENFDEYEIDFFGGEPFLEFELIKKVFEYTTTTYPQKKLLFTATTNGTLVRGEIQEWLKQRAKMFCCGLSLDGTKRMHDLNRCNSFDSIDIDFFYQTWPNQEMKMTVSQETLPFLSEGIIFMHERGYAFTVNLAFDIDWSAADNEKILERELMILIDYYLEHPNITPCTLLNLPIWKVSIDQTKDSFRQCGAGIEMISYDYDGKGYPCQFFMPLSIGKEKSEAADSIEFPENISRENFDENCKNCVAIEICHTCYGSNYASTGNIFSKDKNWCKLQKVIFRANAYFASKKFENGSLHCSEAELPYTLKSVVTLLTDFN
jgi:radical SAM protein with 4Fe4S-binding SPASM domain